LSTDTHDLIERLSTNVQPVAPVRRAGVRAALLSLSTLFLALLVLRVTHEPRPDLAASFGQSIYLIQGAAILIAGLLSAYAACRLSVPDTRIRPPVKVALAASSVLWLTMIGFELIQTTAAPAAAPSCFIGLTLGMSAPLALGIVMLMRSAPVWRGWAGYALVLAIGSFSALGMRFICPNDSPSHLLVWHFLPVIILAAIGYPLGQILLKLTIAKK
jgi:hypothetical protein